MIYNTVSTLGGYKSHYSTDGKKTLCGRDVSNGCDGHDMCKRCINLKARQKTVAEMTREAIAAINPNHPEAQPVAAPIATDVKVTTKTGERITYAHIPNGDPERIEHFRNLAERSGAFTNITAEPRRKPTAVPAPVMHYGASVTLCGAQSEYMGSDHCTGTNGPCPNACQCGCNTGAFECQCTNLTETVTDVTCEPCKDGLHRPVDARSDAMVEREPSSVPEAPQDAAWDRESTVRALSGGTDGAPELNTGHTPLYDFPVTVRKVEPTPAPNAPQKAAWRVVDTNTGKEVTLPTTRPDFRGDMGTVTGIADFPQPGKSGKLYHDRMGRVCYPGVYGLKIVPDTEGDTLPETTTARAANGHTMEYRVTGKGEDGRYTVSQWDAWHSDTCPCATSNSSIY